MTNDDDTAVQESSSQAPTLSENVYSDYSGAILRVAWDLHADTKLRTLLFASLELLPTEIPPPPQTPDVGKRLGTNSRHRIFVWHVPLTLEDALSWYRGCLSGSATLPPPESRSGEIRPLVLSTLSEEPKWPQMSCLDVEQESVPFCPANSECSRTHHLLPGNTPALMSEWTVKESKIATAFLEEQLFFSLDKFPEYWGSVNLVAPNPLFREIDIRVYSETPPAESVVLRIMPRAGKQLGNLHLEIREERASGHAGTLMTSLRSSPIRVKFPSDVERISVSVTDPERGCLYRSKNSQGFTSIGLTFEASSAVRVIDEPGVKPLKINVISTEPERRSVGRERALSPAQTRLRAAGSDRSRRLDADLMGQRWFSGQKDEATKALQRLLNNASRRVMIVDPYFAEPELRQYGLVVSRVSVPIEILSSAELLKEVENVPEFASPPAPAPSKGEVLLQTLLALRRSSLMNPLAIRVMRGERPAVHDRFLLIDHTAWLIGSSLNEFGSRGTMMVRLPDPAPVVDALAQAWADAVDLEEWITCRQQRLQIQNGASGNA